MSKMLELTQMLLIAIIEKDIQKVIELVDELKTVSDTYKVSC